MKSLTYSTQQEEKIEIPIPGTKLHINGILRGSWDQPLIILMHGLPSSNRSLLPFLGAKLLSESGFATLRLNMYDHEAGTRDMVDCLLQTHADDFDVVVEYVRKKNSPKIMAAGHSYGGLTILRSKAKLDAAVLWDSSHFECSKEFDDERDKTERPVVVEEEGIVAYLSGQGYLDSIPMVEERRKLMQILEEELAQKDYPLLFIAAGNGALLPYLQRYMTVANDPKELVIVESASHTLDDTDEILFKTFDNTIKWFEQYTGAK